MKLFYIDLEQAESRAVGLITFRLFDDPTYLDACESGDLHTRVCSMCWRKLPWTGNLKTDKEIAEQKAYREMSYRDLAKRLGHGSNYYGKPPHMSKTIHVEQSVVERFQREYFTAFPAIPRWHRWVAEQLQLHRELTTFMGRRRYFFGRPDDDATLREAIAYEPQSAVADYMNLGLLRTWKRNYPIHLFAQVHDAIAGTYDEQDENWIIPAICKELEIEINVKDRRFLIPTEPLVGWNLGKSDENNPDGLKFWSGSDARVRASRTSIKDFKHKET